MFISKLHNKKSKLSGKEDLGSENNSLQIANNTGTFNLDRSGLIAHYRNECILPNSFFSPNNIINAIENNSGKFKESILAEQEAYQKLEKFIKTVGDLISEVTFLTIQERAFLREYCLRTNPNYDNLSISVDAYNVAKDFENLFNSRKADKEFQTLLKYTLEHIADGRDGSLNRIDDGIED
jgi:hypothetical protein